MRVAENTTCPQTQYFLEAYHGKKRQLAALSDQAHAIEAQKKGVEQEIAALKKLAGLTDKQ